MIKITLRVTKTFVLGAFLALAASLHAAEKGGLPEQSVHPPGEDRSALHRIDIRHPSSPNGKPIPCELVVTTDEQGFPHRYHMDVDSVVCGDGMCGVVTVRLFWNSVGAYERFTLPGGGTLTKKDHEIFTRKDYARLHEILADRDSIFGQISADQIISPSEAIEDVDAITGATPQTIRDAVVDGAVYTSYTLWHWANGDAVDEIRRLTGKLATDEHLLTALKQGEDAVAILAMKSLARRRRHDETTIQAIVERVANGRAVVARAAVDYLETVTIDGNPEIYYKGMERLFAKADTQKRTFYLSALSATSLTPPAGFFDRLSHWLPRLDTYYEIHLLLELMEARNPGSEIVTEQAMAVLTNDNFLIARRAFWYMEKQSLAPVQQRRVDAFKTRYRERL